jgi:hypothetical protein
VEQTQAVGANLMELENGRNHQTCNSHANCWFFNRWSDFSKCKKKYSQNRELSLNMNRIVIFAVGQQRVQGPKALSLSLSLTGNGNSSSLKIACYNHPT